MQVSLGMCGWPLQGKWGVKVEFENISENGKVFGSGQYWSLH